jgi:UrcA family protein
MKQLLLFAALAVSAAPASATALGNPDQAVVLVEYSRADLATASGRAVLEKRVHRAARNFCDEPGRKSAANRQRIGDCIDQAVKAASQQIQLAANAFASADDGYSG